MTPHKDFCLDSCPSVPTPLLSPSPVLSDVLQVYHPHAAGIDIGEAEHWVAVPPECDPQPVRRFGTFTADLVVMEELMDMTATQTRGRSGLSDRQPSLVDGDDRPDPLLLCLRQLRGGRTESGLHQLCTPDTLW